MKPWKLVNEERLFEQAHLKIDKLRYELPNGKQKDYLVRNLGNVAKIFGITKENEIILIRQFRVGPQEVVYELPGGFCNPGEDYLVAARREFLEETGYAGELELLTSFWSDAYSTMKVFCFLARNCCKIQRQNLDEDEFIELNLVSKNRLQEMLFEGQMRDNGICALGLQKI